MERAFVRGVAIVMIAVLVFLTLGVALEHGVDVLVVLSFVVLAVVGIGVFGALGSDD